MATKKASDLAEQLLGSHYGGSTVEGVMHAGGCHYGGGMDSVKDFYAKHKTPVLAVGAVVGAALIGWAGYAIYKKFIWTPPADQNQ